MDLSYNRKIMKACGLSRMTPSRRIFDRRLVTISGDIKNRIIAMSELFVRYKIVDPSIILSAEIVPLSRLKDMSGINPL